MNTSVLKRFVDVVAIARHRCQHPSTTSSTHTRTKKIVLIGLDITCVLCWHSLFKKATDSSSFTWSSNMSPLWKAGLGLDYKNKQLLWQAWRVFLLHNFFNLFSPQTPCFSPPSSVNLTHSVFAAAGSLSAVLMHVTGVWEEVGLTRSCRGLWKQVRWCKHNSETGSLLSWPLVGIRWWPHTCWIRSETGEVVWIRCAFEAFQKLGRISWSTKTSWARRRHSYTAKLRNNISFSLPPLMNSFYYTLQ